MEKEKKKMKEAQLKVTLFEDEDITVAVSDTCLAEGTSVSMADGSFKNIEDVSCGDLVLTFDHEAGCFTSGEIIHVYKGEEPRCAFTVYFENDASLSIVGGHDLFERESLKYVTLTEENAKSFIGKYFYSVKEKAYVKLTGVVHEIKKSEYYELYTGKCFNIVANGMLNVADDVDHMLNIYEFHENLKADMNALEEDIEKFGKFNNSLEGFEGWNMHYLTVAAGKGLVTWERLCKQHFDYIDSSNESQSA